MNSFPNIPVRKHGLGLVEALISLTITATLLTAVAMAFSASSSAIEMNDQFYRAQQSARISLNQVMDQVRKCQSGSVSTTSLTLTNSAGDVRTYSLSGTDLSLAYQAPGSSTAQTAKMASNITTLQFTTNGNSISMLVTVAVGANQITLCGSAFPRRLIVYQ